jgi:hypothetical protein
VLTPDSVGKQETDNRRGIQYLRRKILNRIVGGVKIKWSIAFLYSLLFSVFFHYAERLYHSIFIDLVGGVIIYASCNFAYFVLFEKNKKSPSM